MPKQNRNTLKSFFSAGALPTSDMFEDLVDSTINLSDDGFEKTESEGFKIANFADYQTLTSYYHETNLEKPAWQLKFDGFNHDLVWGSEGNQLDLKNAWVLSKKNQRLSVGVGKPNPEFTLDVQGAMRSQERRGGFGRSFQTVDANGQWQDATDWLTGGVTLEVVARAQNLSAKRYGMIHAIAMHTPWRRKQDLLGKLGFRNRIRYTHAYQESMLHKLKLRWLEDKEGYKLQIRSNCKYGDDSRLDFHITRLWSDEDPFVDHREDSGDGQ